METIVQYREGDMIATISFSDMVDWILMSFGVGFMAGVFVGIFGGDKIKRMMGG